MRFSNRWASRPALRSRLLGLALAGTWLVAFGAAAQPENYRESYQAGMEAWEERKWNEVVRHMRAAIAEQPQAGERIRTYGMQFPRYLPYYHLGMALYELGDCDGAAPAWRRSELQKALSKSQLRTLQERREDCQEQRATEAAPPPPPPAPRQPLPPPPPPPAPSRPEVDPEALVRALQEAALRIEEGDKTLEELENLRRDPDTAPLFARSPELVDRLAELKKRIDVSRETLERGRESEDLDIVEEASRQASSARLELLALQAEVERIRWEMAQNAAEATRRETLLGEIGALATHAQATLTSAADLTNEDRETEEIVENLREYLRKAEAAGNETSISELEVLWERLSETIDALEEAVEQPPAAIAPPAILPPSGPSPALPSLPPPSPPRVSAALRSAVEAFFGAEYRETLEKLRGVELTLPRERATAHLLRAAAHHALYLEGGRQDPKLRQAAVADVAACRKLDPQIELPATFFSPAFANLFREVK